MPLPERFHVIEALEVPPEFMHMELKDLVMFIHNHYDFTLELVGKLLIFRTCIQPHMQQVITHVFKHVYAQLFPFALRSQRYGARLQEELEL